GERQPGKADTIDVTAAATGQTFDGVGLCHVGNQRDPGLGGGIHAHDPKPPDFDQAVKRRWGRSYHVFAMPGEDDLVVRDQLRTAIDGPERKVGLTAAGGAAQQYAMP